MTPWDNESVPPSFLRPCNEASHKKLCPEIICTLELIFNFITEIPNKDAARGQATVVCVMWVPLCKETSEPFPPALSSGQMTMTLNLDHTHTSEWGTECVNQPRRCFALLHKWIVPFYWGSSSTLATWCKKLIHWKRPWWWERVRAGGEGDDRGWDDGWHHWFTRPEIEQTPGESEGQGSLAWSLAVHGLQRVGHDLATEP